MKAAKLIVFSAPRDLPKPPELVGIMGVQKDTFISPLGEDCRLVEFSLEATEPLVLDTVKATYTGAGPTPSVSLRDDTNGRHTVTLNPSLEPGTWLKLELNVTAPNTNLSATMTVWVAHQPLDVNQEGQTNIQDATAFGGVFRDSRETRLIDINCDGRVNVQDATAFGVDWTTWGGTALPQKP